MADGERAHPDATIQFEQVADEDRHDREALLDHAKHEAACLLCGRGLTTKAIENGRWVRLAQGGSVLVAFDLGDVEGDMGLFPIGSECARKLPPNFLGRFASDG